MVEFFDFFEQFDQSFNQSFFCQKVIFNQIQMSNLLKFIDSSRHFWSNHYLFSFEIKIRQTLVRAVQFCRFLFLNIKVR